jgi:G3E family GTPase
MVRFIALGGFLGAGKTTTMVAAARQLRAAGKRVVVVTNDQGTELVDTALAARGLDGAGAGEVTGGCFCCRFEDLVAVTTRLVEQENADVVIAESVGSCTDLTATVIRPLIALHGASFTVAPLTTILDPIRYLRLLPELDRGDSGHDVAYLYRKQLEDAAIIGVNKMDLLEEDEVAEVASSLSARFPQAEVVPYSAAGLRVGPLLDLWSRQHDSDADLALDYRRYGVAEAGLAWLNQTFDAEAAGGGFVPTAWARTALEAMARSCRDGGFTVGHIKVTVTDAETGSLTKAGLIDADGVPSVDLAQAAAVSRGRAVVNARVECEPAELERLVAAAVREADEVHGVRSVTAGQRSFKPGQPRPTHRILVGAD